jgi:hypothetical protein
VQRPVFFVKSYIAITSPHENQSKDHASQFIVIGIILFQTPRDHALTVTRIVPLSSLHEKPTNI